MNRYRFLHYLAIGLFSFSIFVLIDQVNDRAHGQTAIPSVIEACIDRGSHFAAGGAELIAKSDVEGKEYYLAYTYERGDESQGFPSAQLISVEGGSCTTELWNTQGDFLAYSDYVPFEAAVEFRQVENRIQIERLGRRDFIQAFDLSELDLLREEEEALERLGVLQEIRSNQ